MVLANDSSSDWSNGRRARRPLTWGYALVWYHGFSRQGDDSVLGKLDFLKRHGLVTTGIDLSEMANMDEARRNYIGEELVKHGLRLTPHIGFNYLNAGKDERERETERIAEQLRLYLPLMRGQIATTGMRAGHRFDRVMPLEDKLARISEAMTPLAAICSELGAPLSVENHGDYYIADLVQLCQATKQLYIYLDTGNTYLIGERPLPAFELAAPYTIGTHFKDHSVRPRPDVYPLQFEVKGAALGDGDVPLRECYELLMKHAPLKDKLVMEVEMISPTDMDPQLCLERSLRFIQSLEPIPKGEIIQ
ncbi:sugar phosphate isomerase/epimerase [Paenibacillus sp. CF384]|uniref:sugar phosphate isomerase/epimerase family protein n=1 Tax=Paenibacillus sp. CF384 TaxID=1884382 RepID=UPI00089A162F|nr:TIM barrel protein [Paenibacillus sp. CF384]SDX62072.1 Sugar phosphate isomerase/epimerase [Paenibacillus sp. CF384]